MRKFIFRQSVKMVMLCLIYVASCKTTDNQTATPPTKESFIGATFKSDLALIDRSMAEVESLRYQLPRNKGKDMSQLSFEDIEETLFNRVAQDKGEDILAIYAELKKEPVYQELQLAQAKSLRIMEEKMASARAITDYDLAAILSPFDELLHKTDVSEKYVNYSKALKEAITSTLISHIQDMEKAKEIEDGKEVIKNYDRLAFQNAAQSKISAIEKEILTDSRLTEGEIIILLQTSTLAYEKAALISSILNDDSGTEGGRTQWSWRNFFKVVAIVAAVVVVVAVAVYVAPIIAPKIILAFGSKYTAAQTATTFLKIGGSILKIGSAKSLAITGAGVATALLSGAAGSYAGSQYYCQAHHCGQCHRAYFLYNTVESCN